MTRSGLQPVPAASGRQRRPRREKPRDHGGRDRASNETGLRVVASARMSFRRSPLLFNYLIKPRLTIFQSRITVSRETPRTCGVSSTLTRSVQREQPDVGFGFDQTEINLLIVARDHNLPDFIRVKGKQPTESIRLTVRQVNLALVNEQ